MGVKGEHKDDIFLKTLSFQNEPSTKVVQLSQDFIKKTIVKIPFTN